MEQRPPMQASASPAFLEPVADACLLIDRAWRITYVNRQAERLLGQDRTDLLGRVLWDASMPWLGLEGRASLERALSLGTPQAHETHDAEAGRWMQVRSHPYDDGAFVQVLDITARRVREEERAAWARTKAVAAERAQALLTFVTALVAARSVEDVADTTLTRGFSLVRPDSGTVFLRDGDLLLRSAMSGHTAELVEIWPAVHLDAEMPVATAVRAGQVVALTSGARIAAEYPNAAPWLSRAGVEASLVLPLSSGAEVLGVAALNFRAPRDFSEGELAFARTVAALATLALTRVLAQEAERDAARRATASAAVLDALVNAAPTGLAVFDTDLRWVMINEHLADMNGVPAGDHLGRTPWEVLPDLAGLTVPILERVLVTGAPMLGVEIVGETPKAPGVRRQWVEHFFPVRTPDGTTLGLGVVAQEVTEQRAVEAARQRAVRRTELLAGAAAGLSRALTVDDVADVLVGHAVDGLGATAGTVGLVGADGTLQVRRSTGTLPGGVPLAGAAQAVRRRSVVHPQAPGAPPGGWGVHVPVVGSDTVVAVLSAWFAERPATAADDEVALQGLAAMAGPAFERADRFEREHSIAATLQHALLPDAFTPVPHLLVDARYLPGLQGVEVGGDWYDVQPVAAGAVAASLGDVVGKGVHAAAVMGQVRSAARAYAAIDPHPDAVLAALDRLFATFDRDELATFAYAVVDADAGTVTLVSAGHPPPAVIGPDGAVTLLEEGRSVPLGVGPGGRLAPLAATARTRACTVPFPPGATLVLYSDGLIESTRLPVTEGLAALEAELLRLGSLPVRPSPGAVADGLVAALVGDGARADDVAVLVVHRPVPSGDPVTLELPGSPVDAGTARRFLRRWWHDVVEPAVPHADHHDVELVVSELVTNGLRHVGGTMHLECRLLQTPDWRVRVGVRDRRRSRPLVADLPQSQEPSGRGLGIVAALAARWGVEQDADGKQVWAEVTIAPPPVPPDPLVGRMVTPVG